MDVETLCAALLHDTVEDSSTTKDEVAEEFGQSIADLVDGVTKITKIELKVYQMSRLKHSAKCS